MSATTTSTTQQAPIRVGESREFPAGNRHRIAVTRTTDGYRVVVLDFDGKAIPCYTVEFTPDRIPADMTLRRATWTYIQQRATELAASEETPAQVITRTDRTAIAMPAPATVRRVDPIVVALKQTAWNHGYARTGATLAINARILRRLADAGLVVLDLDLDKPGRRVRGATLTDTGRARRAEVIAAAHTTIAA